MSVSHPENVNSTRARARSLARADRLLKSELVQARKDQGMTQADVAEMLGVSQQAINKFERYDSDPKLSTLRRYANAVGVLVEHSVIEDWAPSDNLATGSGWTVIHVGHVSASLATGRASTLPHDTWSPMSNDATNFELAS